MVEKKHGGWCHMVQCGVKTVRDAEKQTPIFPLQEAGQALCMHAEPGQLKYPWNLEKSPNAFWSRASGRLSWLLSGTGAACSVQGVGVDALQGGPQPRKALLQDTCSPGIRQEVFQALGLPPLIDSLGRLAPVKRCKAQGPLLGLFVGLLGALGSLCKHQAFSDLRSMLQEL